MKALFSAFAPRVITIKADPTLQNNDKYGESSWNNYWTGLADSSKDYFTHSTSSASKKRFTRARDARIKYTDQALSIRSVKNRQQLAQALPSKMIQQAQSYAEGLIRSFDQNQNGKLDSQELKLYYMAPYTIETEKLLEEKEQAQTAENTPSNALTEKERALKKQLRRNAASAGGTAARLIDDITKNGFELSKTDLTALVLFEDAAFVILKALAKAEKDNPEIQKQYRQTRNEIAGLQRLPGLNKNLALNGMLTQKKAELAQVLLDRSLPFAPYALPWLQELRFLATKHHPLDLGVPSNELAESLLKEFDARKAKPPENVAHRLNRQSSLSITEG